VISILEDLLLVITIGIDRNAGEPPLRSSEDVSLFGHTSAIALELAGTGTTVNCIAPGSTQTEMVDAIPDEIQDDLRAKIPLERFADISEIAGLVRYLASEQSGYMTGKLIDVNGGIDL
jgi:3-oxoacyl-[acyl-carrier protein] reductase